MFEVLLAFAILLTVVTLVGHGIWLLVARVVGAGDNSASTANGADSRATTCPRCGLPLSGIRCRTCDWPLPTNVAVVRPEVALEALARQVDSLGHAQVLPPAAAQRLADLITAEQALLPKPVAAPVHAAPVHAPSIQAAPVEVQAISAEIVEEPISAELVGSATSPPAPGSVAPPHPRERDFVSQVPLAERAEQFRRSQLQPSPQPPVPVAPRRSWTDWLAAFMEERNIRWGELVGGLLIVCCSIALVISFWSQIAEKPLLKFLLFNGVTAALFGVGFYSEYRWRLHTTGQGLLSIGTLLVPLNFLAIAAFTSVEAATNPLVIGGELFSTALFATLVFFAGRVLAPGAAWALTFGVLVPSLAQLLVRRFGDVDLSAAGLWGLAALPLATYVGSNAWALVLARRAKDFDEAAANRLFKFHGLTSFAVLTPLGLLLFKSADALATLRVLAPAACLLGAVPLTVGLTLWNRLAGAAQSGLRTAGTSVAVLGALVSLAALGLGWPEPGALLVVAVLEFVVFTAVALTCRLPAAHLPAAACLAIACLLGVYLTEGQLAWRDQDPHALFRTFISGQTGTLLPPLVLLYAAAAWALRGRGIGGRWLTSTAGVLAIASSCLATVSTALVTWFGWIVHGDPLGAFWIYLTYAALSLALAARSRRASVAWVGCALLLAGVVQGVAFRYDAALELSYPLLMALVTFAGASAVIAVAARWSKLTLPESPLVDVLLRASLGVSLIAAARSVLLMPETSATVEAGYWAALSMIWLVTAATSGWLPVWTLAQAGLAVTTLLLVGATLESYAWFRESPRPWLDPWTWQFVGTALAAWCLAWSIARAAVRRAAEGRADEHLLRRGERLLRSPYLAIDRAMAAGLVAIVITLGMYAALPGTRAELAPLASPVSPDAPLGWLSVPHVHARDAGSWLLWGSVLVVTAALAWESRSSFWLQGIMLTSAIACPLVASRFAGELATASAWRWSSAVWLAAVSALLWCRAPITRIAQRIGWRSSSADRSVADEFRLLTLALGIASQLAIGVAIISAAMHRSPRWTIFWDQWYVLAIGGSLLVLVAGAVLALLRSAAGARLTDSAAPRAMATLAALVGVLPWAGLLVYEGSNSLAQFPLAGPAAGSFLGRIGVGISYGLPIAAVALVLAGHALRERRAGFALAGGLGLNVAATIVWLGSPAHAGTLDTAGWIRLAQLNAAVAAIYTLAWLAWLAWDQRRNRSLTWLTFDDSLVTQTAIGPALLAVVFGWAWLDLVREPRSLGPNTPIVQTQLVDAVGWVVLVVTIFAAGAVARFAGRRFSIAAYCGTMTALSVMAAGVATRWDTGNWVAYHTLLVGHGVIVTKLLAIAWSDRWFAGVGFFRVVQSWFDRTNVRGWLDLARAVVLGLALRELAHQRWWPATTLALLAVSGALAAWIFGRRRYLYDAAALINVSGSLAWLELRPAATLADMVYLNVILLTAPVAVWLAIDELRIKRRDDGSRFQLPPAHRVAARLAILTLALAATFGLFADAGRTLPVLREQWLSWAALFATTIASMACLWDRGARDGVARLYTLGLMAVAMTVDQLDLSPPWLLWTGDLVLAAYALATSYLWSRRQGLRSLAQSLRIPTSEASELAHLSWLVPCNLLLITAVVGLTALVLWTENDIPRRVLAAQAVLTQVVSLALIARGDRRGVLQHLALLVGAIGAVMFAWSWLDPHASSTLLNGLVMSAVALAAVGTFYGLGLTKLLSDASDWLTPARRLTPWLAGASLLSLAAVLGDEILQYAQTGAVTISWPAILAVALTLVGLSVAALAAAVLPGRDPLNLSLRGRTLYVYGAEVLLALTFVHVRLTMPWLFSGVFQQYWPLVVMAIAFFGVGFAELCRRWRQDVLAGPLENTGALLPVLPVIGYWAADNQVHYSLLLLTVGVLYAGLSIARRSFGFGVLAALAANGGLWYLLNGQEGWGFLTHPQVWLIPPALCVLAAAYLNRDQLSDAQMTSVRYFTSMAIYLSSTADIFLNGVNQAPWLPAVLAVLSVAGILAGIALRVRAFLLLGTGFLLLALLSIIYHAAVDLHHTWILWVCGIILGVLVIVLFGIFEKKRQEVLGVIERVKQWEA